MRVAQSKGRRTSWRVNYISHNPNRPDHLLLEVGTEAEQVAPGKTGPLEISCLCPLGLSSF